MLVSIIEIYKKLLDYFGHQNWWPAGDDYEMLIGAILTQNTNWKNVEKALSFLEKPLDPNAILSMEQSKLAELIKPSGYYNQKAERIIRFTRWLIETFGSIELIKKNDQPDLRQKLLELKGIGQETADSMLVYAFGIPVFIIDAYTRRLFGRLGYSVPKSYEGFRIQIEMSLGEHFTLQVCNEFHALIVRQAKCFCKAKAMCNGCPLNQYCQYYIEHQ